MKFYNQSHIRKLLLFRPAAVVFFIILALNSISTKDSITVHTEDVTFKTIYAEAPEDELVVQTSDTAASTEDENEADSEETSDASDNISDNISAFSIDNSSDKNVLEETLNSNLITDATQDDNGTDYWEWLREYYKNGNIPRPYGEVQPNPPITNPNPTKPENPETPEEEVDPNAPKKEDYSHYFTNIQKYDVYLPAGEYDFQGKVFTIKDHVKIHGDGKDKTILKNVAFICPLGLTVEDLTIDSGAKTNIWTHYGDNLDARVMFYMIKPDSRAYVEYKNCDFNDADYVSIINGTGNIRYDSATGCSFTNVKRVAIYHAINSGESTYTYNTFKNIGDTSYDNGLVSGIWLGDVANVTYAQSQNATIDHNTMENLYSSNDYALRIHVINANFIAVRANRCTINENTISNCYGYGRDREGIYTKVKYLYVTNNIISDAGCGEGYITCKGYDDPNSFTVITGNTITGENGTAIYLYGPGQIKSNKIYMSACRSIITCFVKDVDSTKKLSVSANIIKCTPGYYYRGKEKLTTFTPKNLITIEASKYEVFFQSNDITIEGDDPNICGIARIANIATNVTATANTITTTCPNAIALMLNANENYYDKNKNCVCAITSNTLLANDLGLQIVFNNKNGKVSNRTFYIKSNKLAGSDKIKYGIYLNGGVNNNDYLEYSSNQGKNYLSNQIFAICKKVNSTSLYVTQSKI